MKIKIEIIDAGDGIIAVLPPLDDLKEGVDRLKEASPEKAEQADSILKSAEESRAKWKENIKVREYEIRQFTYGEEIEAQRIATEWHGDRRHCDMDLYWMHLLGVTLQKPEADVRSIEAVVAKEIIRQLQMLNAPTAEKLDFLDLKPIGSASAAQLE